MLKNVLVTGGAGYIGSHACKALSQAGFTPVVYDNFSTGHRDFVKWGPLVEGDIRDREALDVAFAEYAPVALMHFAALTYVGESVTEPAKYYHNNVSGSLQLLEAAKQAGVLRVVFSSTCATYGQPETLPMTEDTPQVPINPYGQSKKMVENILADFDHAYGMRSICLRYFNACGGDPDGEIGEDHDPELHLIPRVIFRGMGKNIELTVFGDDYPTPDGTALRDYIHVTDLAEAHILALNKLMSGGASDRLNVGLGKSYSVLEVIKAASRITGTEITYELGPRRAGDPAELTASVEKAKASLGFTASRSDLDNILHSAWKWHEKRHKNLIPREN